MCNLYRLRVPGREMAAHYQAGDAWQADLAKEYVSPGRPAPVVTMNGGSRSLRLMEWGCPFQGKRVVNVRNYDSPFWRSALADPARRCLVPFTSFQEWAVEPDPATGKKRPHDFTIPAARSARSPARGDRARLARSSRS